VENYPVRNETCRKRITTVLAHKRYATGVGSDLVIQLLGIDGASKQIAGRPSCGGGGWRRLYRLPIDNATAGQSGDLELLLRCRAGKRPVAVACTSDAQGSGNLRVPVRAQRRCAPVPVPFGRYPCRCGSGSWASVAQESWTVRVAKPTVEEQQQKNGPR